jgi:hypothetical protein
MTKRADGGRRRAIWRRTAHHAIYKATAATAARYDGGGRRRLGGDLAAIGATAANYGDKWRTAPPKPSTQIQHQTSVLRGPRGVLRKPGVRVQNQRSPQASAVRASQVSVRVSAVSVRSVRPAQVQILKVLRVRTRTCVRVRGALRACVCVSAARHACGAD